MTMATRHVTTESGMNVAIAILAKAPIPGLSKTRLIPNLGAEGAAGLQRWLLQRTVGTTMSAGLGPVTLWCTPDTTHPEFTRLAGRASITLRRQTSGDLGERMLQALRESPGAQGTLLIGTDCPTLKPSHLQAAARGLDAHPAVFIPAEDGGYVLVGMRDAHPEPFSDIEWSTERVMAQTRQRLAAIGWRWQEFEPLWDVDREEDLERLQHAFPECRELCVLQSNRRAGAEQVGSGLYEDSRKK